NKINETTLSLLVELAHEMDLKDAIQKMFSGEIINKTEQRAVLHTALRANRNQSIFVDGVDVIPEVFQVKDKIKSYTDRSEEHTSELQSRENLVCRLLLE